MPKTYVQMQNDLLLQAQLNNHDRPVVQLALNAALQELCSERRWTWMRRDDTITLLAGTTDLVLPVGVPGNVMGRIQRVTTPANSSIPVPEFVRYDTEDPAQLWVRGLTHYQVPRAFPEYWTFVDPTTIRFDAAPPQDVGYEMAYWEDAPQMTVDGDAVPVPDAFLDALMWNALDRVLLIHDHRLDVSGAFRMRYQDALQKLVNRDVGQTQTLRVPMPPGYGGAYDG